MTIVGRAGQPAATAAEGTLGIAFRGREVAVRSAAPEVLDGLRERFGALVAADACDGVRYVDEPHDAAGTPTSTTRSRPAMMGCIEVCRDEAGYHLPIDDKASVRGGTLDDVVRCAEYHVVRRLIAATPELVWLHAGAVAKDGGAVLIVGPSGSGKSTLATGLCARGYAYLADDTVPMDPAVGLALPFPRAPAVRQATGQELPPEQLHSLAKTALHLDPADICQDAQPVHALIFPTYAPRAAGGLVRCPPAAAAFQLIQHCLNVADHGEAAVLFLCTLAEGVPAFHLTYSDGDTAAKQLARAHE